jgi:hypothetical protein
MAEGWKDDAEGLLIFVGPHAIAHNLESVDCSGLFSAAVAALLAVTLPTYSAEFAGRLNLLLGTNLSATGFPIERIQNFHPVESVRTLPAIHTPAAAIWVNGLAFLSPLISLTCALLAKLLQQWARRYLIVATHGTSGPAACRR